MVTTNWTNRTEPTTNWQDRMLFLATEIFQYILTEDDKKIQVSGVDDPTYTLRTKPTTNWTNIT